MWSLSLLDLIYKFYVHHSVSISYIYMYVCLCVCVCVVCVCGCVHYLSIVIILYLVHTNVEFVVECVLRFAGGVKGKVCVCVPQLYSELTQCNPLHASLNRDDAQDDCFPSCLDLCVHCACVSCFIFGILYCVFSLPPSLPPSLSFHPLSLGQTCEGSDYVACLIESLWER